MIASTGNYKSSQKISWKIKKKILRWRVQNTRMQTGYVPSNYVRKEKPSIFDSIKKKVRVWVEGEMRLVCVQVKGGGNQGAGSRTLPSSNSSPVHSVPPPPHTSEYPTPHTSYTLTQHNLTQTWKRQGTDNPPRQKTRSQYPQQLWNTTTRWANWVNNN